MKNGICLITFSNNADHQNGTYSMFTELKKYASVYTVGIKKPKSIVAQHTNDNYYYDVPERPGITKGTFNFRELFKIAKMIKENDIKYIYFESMHIWNMFLMLLCPKCTKVVAVHDVIPHDSNRAMALCNFVTAHMADHIVLRNSKYKEQISTMYKLKESKITSLELWRHFPDEKAAVHSGKFLCFGRIRKYKGFGMLIDIIRNTPEAKFTIVGEPDEESVPLVEEIKKMPNTEVFDTEVSDVEMEEFFEHADWVILPYETATQSGVITDACRFSRPVICFNVGALAEQVENGITGYLIEAHNTKEFSDTIKKVSVYDDDTLDSFSHAAYKFGYQKYSTEVLAPLFLELLRSLN